MILAWFGAETLRAEVVQPRPWATRLESSAPAPESWPPALLGCPSNPPESALPPLGQLTVEVSKEELTVASFDLVTSFGPGSLQ